MAHKVLPTEQRRSLSDLLTGPLLFLLVLQCFSTRGLDPHRGHISDILQIRYSHDDS